MLVKLEFGDVSFCGGRKTEGPAEKPSQVIAPLRHSSLIPDTYSN